MALTEAFFEAVNSKDLKDIRIMMKDSFLVDPTFKLFDEMEKETKGMPELYVEHDGREMKMDKNLWDDEYMNLLMVQVVRNFSHERVDHLKEVVRFLHPVTKLADERTPDLEGKTEHVESVGNRIMDLIHKIIKLILGR